MKLGIGLGADGVDELVHERLGRHVAHPLVAEHGADVVADRVQEVGLAQAGRAVDEQRVVGPAGALGHRQRGGVGEAVRRADDELVERVAGVERARGPRAGRGRRRRARRGDRASGRGRVVDGAPRRGEVRASSDTVIDSRRRSRPAARRVTVAPVRSRMASVSIPE